MDHKDYTEFCKSIESVPEAPEVDMAQLQTAVRLVIVGNQMLDLMKKNLFYGKAVDEQKWVNALHDINSIMDLEVSRAKNGGNPASTPNFDIRLAHSIIGMSTESGEMLEAMDAAMFEDQEFDTVNFGEECSDLFWYFSIGLDAGENDINNVMAVNRKKLEKRYSKGKFTEEDAQNRDLDSERKILEDGFAK